MNLMLYGWIKKAMKDMQVKEWDMTAEAFGMELEELYLMVVMDKNEHELDNKVDMEGLYGKNWT